MNLNGHCGLKNGSSNGKPRASISEDSSILQCFSETRVLVIYTGGTIGMLRDDSGALVPVPGALAQRVRGLPQMHDEEYARTMPKTPASAATLVLPDVKNHGRRIIYEIQEWETLIDSSDMTIDNWIQIAKNIEDNYVDFDGFVVLHGTDTMSYTASALSFMLENLGKPVVITGSQIPIFEPRSDGADNFVSALIIASTQKVPEVTLFFWCKLYRGNRTTKKSTEDFEAFHSPNFEPLATSGIDLEVNTRLIFKPTSIAAFRAHTQVNPNVALVRIFPSITDAAIHAFLQPPIEGIVLETYGAGNIPSGRMGLHNELKAAANRGIIIVNITQCSQGSVRPIYKTGQCLQKCGVISGYDMTPETALAKLSYVLSKNEWNLETKKKMIQTSLRGELTGEDMTAVEDFSVIDAIGHCMGASGPSEAAHITSKSVMPALLSHAAMNSRADLIEKLQDFGADVCALNADDRSALHVAACCGDVPVIMALLHRGANVHVTDRYGNSPLMDAMHQEQAAAVEVLLRCGAHLRHCDAPRLLAEVLAAAGKGLIRRLELYKMAGAELGAQDATGRTALHMAALFGDKRTVEYLLEEGLSPKTKDIFSLSPLDYARQGGHQDTVKLLENLIR